MFYRGIPPNEIDRTGFYNLQFYYEVSRKIEQAQIDSYNKANKK